MNTQPVTFVWPGDMHLEFPDRPNYQTALWMADEVNELIKRGEESAQKSLPAIKALVNR